MTNAIQNAADALRNGATTNAAYRMAGYVLVHQREHSGARLIVRGGRIVGRSSRVETANRWLERLASRIK